MKEFNKYKDIPITEYFGTGAEHYICLFLYHKGNKKIVICAKDYADAIAKVRLRFDFIKKQEILTDDIIKIYFNNDNVLYIYKNNSLLTSIA